MLLSSAGIRGCVLRTRVLASLVLGLLLIAGSAGAKQPLKVGDVPPDSLGRTLQGERVKLGDYRGKVVIVTFWATWCGPCRQEMPVLATIQKKVSRDQLVVFAVNWKEDHDRFREVAKRLKDIDLSLVSDPDGYYGQRYDVTSIPHMIIVGRDGRVAAIHVGYGEGEIPVLVKEINELLAARSEPQAVSTTAPTSSP
jgi:thiol-disulfide isomerase/thioredoxin